MQISFVMLIFLLFLDQIPEGDRSIWGGGKLPQGVPPASPCVKESQITDLKHCTCDNMHIGKQKYQDKVAEYSLN